MGKLIYEQSAKTDFDDRVLAHLQHVIMSKLRRGESFALTWKEDVSVGSGRTSVWLHPHVSLQFKYYGTRQPSLNRAWLEALTHAANGANGLYVVPEPAPDDRRLRAAPRQEQDLTVEIVPAD